MESIEFRATVWRTTEFDLEGVNSRGGFHLNRGNPAEGFYLKKEETPQYTKV